MASANIGAWLPITYNSSVYGYNVEKSAVMEAVGRPTPMVTKVVQQPTLGASDVNQGSTLIEDTNDGGMKTMYGAQFNGKRSLDEWDVEIARRNGTAVFDSYSAEWMSDFHLAFDNASIGVSAVHSSTDSAKRPYDSIYYEVATNAPSMLTTGALGYDSASAALGRLEKSYYGGNDPVIFAHPGLREKLRGIKDDDARPIFLSCTTGDVIQDTLFGHRVYWTHGARVTANHGQVRTGSGNLLLVLVNPRALWWGELVAPQRRVINADLNPNELAHTLVHRAIEGFGLKNANAASILSVTP